MANTANTATQTNATNTANQDNATNVNPETQNQPKKRTIVRWAKRIVIFAFLGNIIISLLWAGVSLAFKPEPPNLTGPLCIEGDSVIIDGMSYPLCGVKNVAPDCIQQLGLEGATVRLKLSEWSLQEGTYWAFLEGSDTPLQLTLVAEGYAKRTPSRSFDEWGPELKAAEQSAASIENSAEISAE